jgi:signal transduction histidine kinase/CheY-like chemotaxis protein/CHASE3 domain sensor protein
MNLRNVRIGVQLKLGFAALLLFVIVLGAASYLQTSQMHKQTETMYNHPFQVQRAIAALRSNVLSIHRDTKDLLLDADEQEIAEDLKRIEISKASAFEQIDIMYRLYLGPRSDIDSVRQSFITWNSMRDETLRLLRAGRTREAAERTSLHGIAGRHVEALLKDIDKIDSFSKAKADSLKTISENLAYSLMWQLIILVSVILLLSIIINYIVLRNIRKPLDILTGAAQSFRHGNMETRSSYALQNEFGLLSAAFNDLAESVQLNTELSEKTSELAGLMLSEDDAKKFFQTTLKALAAHTGSQITAVYLLSDDRKHYEHFESFGMDAGARPSFSADSHEGEFGAALITRRFQHIKDIPDDTRFIFHTAGGKFIPREIITIPIIAGNDIIAFISIATLNLYDDQALRLVENILDTLSSRVAGILAYRKIRLFMEQLEHQNRELEAQKSELALQSAELTHQNTELEMQKKQLYEAGRLKTTFLSNMSHELRTPLNSVIALSGVLSRRLANIAPPEEFSYLEVIERNGKHLLALINDILDLSRIESGKEELEITKFSVNGLISEVVSMIRPQANQTNIELLHTGKDENIMLASDADKCRHILQNIIGNAVKFTEKGKVEVSVKQGKDDINIIVSDTGIGISAAHIPHIFDEFRQADSSASRKFGGTGLGLAIAKKYADMVGGSISVKSRTGRGSEFTITLPLRYAPEHKVRDFEIKTGPGCDQEQIPTAPVPEPSARTILLVEDSMPAIIQIRDILEGSGHQALVANDGQEALDMMSGTMPDAVILDLMMPGIDGFETLRIMRETEHTANIPVLVLTAKHITKAELSFLKQNNIHQLIQKGDVNRSELIAAVAGMVSPRIAEPAKPKQAMQTIEGKPLVLVVEDNPDNILTIRALLAGKHTVIEATDGVKGVEMAKKDKPDLILMDIALPKMDGIEAFKAIRKDPDLRHIPVIAVTASAMISDRETILAYGFDAYVAKPLDEKSFIKTINETLYGK